MFKLPSTNNWVQSNSGEGGTIQRTRNICFDEVPFAKLSKRTRSILTENGSFKRTSAIVYLDVTNEYLVFGQQGIYRIAATSLVATDGSGDLNAPGSDSAGRSDGVPWQGFIYSVGPSGTMRRYNGSGWSGNLVTTSQTTAGPLAVEPKQNIIGVGQGRYVDAYNTTHTLLFTLDMGAEYSCTSIDSWNGFFVVVTRNVNNGRSVVILWNATSASANSPYFLDATRIYSVKAYRDTFAVATSEGKLMKFNGGGFELLDSFPIDYKDVDWDMQGNLISSRIIHRGMIVDGNRIYINLSPRILLPATDLSNHMFENYFEGGVWCYDPAIKLHHRYSHASTLRSTETIATASVDTTNDIITVASAPNTGTPIIYDNGGGTSITGLVHRTKYFAVYVTSTTIKLASTRANAIAGTVIDFTGTGNNSQILIYLPNRDFGGSCLGGNSSTTDAGGAICLVANKQNVYRTDAAQVIFGTKLGSTSTTELYGLAVASFGQENRGFIITPRLESSGISDLFQNVTVKYRGVDTPDDKIIFSYRTVRRNDTLKGIDQPLTYTATWVNTSIFTTTADISSAKIGDEVSFHSGSGSGYIAHISSLSLTAGTYTVKIDEVLENVTGGDTVCFVIDNFIKTGDNAITITDNLTMVNENNDVYVGDSGSKSFTLNKQTSQLEIKLELRGEDVAIEDILVNNRPFKTYIV